MFLLYAYNGGRYIGYEFRLCDGQDFRSGNEYSVGVYRQYIESPVYFIFFATNSHLVLIELAVSSYDLFSVGAGGLSLLSAAEFAVDIFGAVFGLALRLAIPFIAVEFILEISMGILMKLIPQIHVFVIEFQFKILLAILLLYVLANPISVFIDNYILIMFDYMHDALQAASG